MNDRDKLRRLVAFALPKECEFAEENFAGDPHVRAFCDYLQERCETAFHVFVAWRCPPEVKCLTSKRVIVRSERLDTLLVEYCRLPRVSSQTKILSSSILGWMSEMLIGYGQADLAIHALAWRRNLPRCEMTPFRDEALASLPTLDRAAVQCFCLAHEVGHLVVPRREGVTLAAEVDGCSLAQHIGTQERLDGLPDDQRAADATLRNTKLDAGSLLEEVEVDLFAFRALVAFLLDHFPDPIESMIRSALLSVEALSFVYACKSGCRLLALVANGTIGPQEFLDRAYLTDIAIAVRARAIARHAGILWARIETPPDARDYNAYVARVDAIVSPNAGFRISIAALLAEHRNALLAALEENAGERRDSWRAHLENDGKLRLEVYDLLIAFGCSGAVEPVAYLESIQRR